MKSLLFLLLLTTSDPAATLQPYYSNQRPEINLSHSTAADVFICKGGSAYAYHKTENCRWLANCTHEIIKVSEEEAIEKYHRKPCKACYK